MTAPFAPELTSPVNRGASAGASVTLSWKFRSAAAGDYMATFAVRRRQMYPSVGSYEYWTGAAWSTETFINGPTAPNQVYDGMTGSITITTGWTAGSVYQWSIKCRNAATEASVYADDSLIQIHNAPTMTITVNSTAVSRPKLSWVFTGATGFYQRSYRIAVYTAAVRAMPGFSASSASFQALATYIMPATVFSSSDYKIQVDADMASGTQYYVYYKVEDSSELSSGWVEGPNFTPSYTAAPAPTMTITPDAANGTVNLVVRSSFNQLSDDQSVFTNGIGSWIASLNCVASWDQANGKLLLTTTGMSYAALDTAWGTFANQDTAYATYATEIATMASPTGTSRGVSGDTIDEMIAVTPGVNYSAIATLNCSVSGRTAKLGIRWWTSGGVAASTAVNQGTGVALTINTNTDVSVTAVTAPGNAAYASVEVEWTTAAIGDIMRVDNVAFASSDTIAWSPGGNLNVSFVAERSTDGGTTWKPVWGCGKAAPRISDSLVVGQITVTDRSVPLGTSTIQYRAYAISNYSTTPIWSTVATQSISGFAPAKWFLRRTETPSGDCQVVVGSVDQQKDLKREVFELEGRSEPVVAFSASPKTETINVSLMTLSKANHEAVMAALLSEETLYLQTNRDGEGYYIRAVDSVGRSAKRANPVETYNAVRHLFSVNFSAVVVQDYV